MQPLDKGTLQALEKSLRGFAKDGAQLKVATKVRCAQPVFVPTRLTVLQKLSSSLCLFRKWNHYFCAVACLASHHVCAFVQVDATILGGLIVEIGDKYIDMSISTRVRKIASTLRDPL